MLPCTTLCATDTARKMFVQLCLHCRQVWENDCTPETFVLLLPPPGCAGFAYAPLLATRLVCGRLARPAAVVGAAVAAMRGVLRFVNIRGLSPANLLKQLQEAAISFGGDCLEVRRRGPGSCAGCYTCCVGFCQVHRSACRALLSVAAVLLHANQLASLSACCCVPAVWPATACVVLGFGAC